MWVCCCLGRAIESRLSQSVAAAMKKKIKYRSSDLSDWRAIKSVEEEYQQQNCLTLIWCMVCWEHDLLVRSWFLFFFFFASVFFARKQSFSNHYYEDWIIHRPPHLSSTADEVFFRFVYLMAFASVEPDSIHAHTNTLRDT